MRHHCHAVKDSNLILDFQRLKPRPGLPLRPGQVAAKALVLDAEKGVKIPGPINTYLRDYQRDGVKFLWRQYSEGRGGLLGDDMGLVSNYVQAMHDLLQLHRVSLSLRVNSYEFIIL